MAKHFDITCVISPEGRLPLSFGERVRDVLKALAGREIQFTIADPKRYSTNPQRQYYFGVIVTHFQQYFAANGQWIDKDDLHESMMTEIGNLWREEPNPFTRSAVRRRRSYNNLTTTEAENYHTQCRQWAAERGFDIPEPNEEKAPKYIERGPSMIEGPVIEHESETDKAYNRLRHFLENEEEIPK